jgi:UDP-arabinose 4-epimerase
VPRAIMAAMGSLPELQVFGTDFPTRDGTCIRDYIHVSDLARAHVSGLAALGSGTPSQSLNLGTGRGYSVHEVMQAVETQLGRKVPHSAGPRRAGDPAEVVADARRAEAVLGWSARESDLATIVATSARWHARHRSSANHA